MSEPHAFIDFSEEDSTEWHAVNDGVMGGVSRSNIHRTKRGTGMFAGNLSLENNGGFASVRAVLGRQDLSHHRGLEIRVRGDGRTYQLRLRTDGRFDAIAYRAPFQTVENEWLTVRIPFEAFTPVFRNRRVNGAPPLDTGCIEQLTFMLADKRPGSFSLEIDSVRGWTAVDEIR